MHAAEEEKLQDGKFLFEIQREVAALGEDVDNGGKAEHAENLREGMRSLTFTLSAITRKKTKEFKECRKARKSSQNKPKKDSNKKK